MFDDEMLDITRNILIEGFCLRYHHLLRHGVISHIHNLTPQAFITVVWFTAHNHIQHSGRPQSTM